MHKVKIFSTPTCPWCMRAKQYLDAKGIAYENADVSSNEQAQEEMIKISGQMGVPVIVVDGNIVVGFDKARLEELLK
ncbi:MAG: glutaredoxin family protein [Candidatus Omnitrophica bacterium]|nr:glutaredoxin family protein [Candidatus Omnitrophota bacterium]MDD5236733.1 glutaredoxin family protein [Candidatus Omnitrophota bacterium]MDD5610294.1 glutaredoxin family protein [Candidatus Omnitrophota bacterium]